MVTRCRGAVVHGRCTTSLSWQAFWQLGVVLFRDGVREEALGNVAARSGFWSVRLRDVRGLAERLGPELAEGQSLFEVLQALTMRVLKFSREEELLRTWPCGCCGERKWSTLSRRASQSATTLPITWSKQTRRCCHANENRLGFADVHVDEVLRRAALASGRGRSKLAVARDSLRWLAMSTKAPCSIE